MPQATATSAAVAATFSTNVGGKASATGRPNAVIAPAMIRNLALRSVTPYLSSR